MDIKIGNAKNKRVNALRGGWKLGLELPKNKNQCKNKRVDKLVGALRGRWTLGLELQKKSAQIRGLMYIKGRVDTDWNCKKKVQK